MRTVALARAAEARIVGTRFCAHHGASTAAQAGAYVMCGRVKRWVCFTCQDRRRTAVVPLRCTEQR